MNKGAGQRWTNFLLGIAIFSFALSIPVHRSYTKNVFRFKPLSFLFCFDSKTMQSEYTLNKHRASDQVRAQSVLVKLAWVWYAFYLTTIGSDILKFAMENPSSYSAVYFGFRTIWYFLLFLSQQASVLRSFLVLGQLEMAALYLHNRLNTLNDRIESTNIPKLRRLKLNKFIENILSDYNGIIQTQKQTNSHCERCFYMYFTYALFTLAFPIVILFENHEEYFLFIFNLVSYFSVVFGILWPPIVFNTYFTQAVFLCFFGFFLVS